jgi:hypothetical protein
MRITLCRRPFYTQKRRHISELSANRYILSFGLDESRQREYQWFLSRLSFVPVHTRTCVSVSPVGYKNQRYKSKGMRIEGVP